MLDYRNLVEVLKAAAALDEKGITFINGDSDERYVSYKMLYDRACCVLYRLQAGGLKKGDELVLQVEGNESFLYVFWACLLGGIMPVPITVGNNEEHRLKLLKIWKVLTSPWLVTDANVFNTLRKFTKECGYEEEFKVIEGRAMRLEDVMGASRPGEVCSPGPEDIAFIQFSSGSTGEPKGVTLTHDNLIANLDAVIHGADFRPGDSFLGWMPLTHDMGMIGFHLLPLTLNIDQFIMPTALFVRHPVLWMKKANEHKATILSSPNFGYKYFLTHFTPEAAKGWDLSHIRLIFNGAEPISAELCDTFTAALREFGLARKAMYTVYGLAEASVAVAFPPLGEEYVSICLDRRCLGAGQRVVELADRKAGNAVAFADVGYPIRYISLRICDDENRVLEDMVAGRIQIKGRNVTHGYYNNREATARAITEDGWLDTGDLGFTREGRLVVTGRAKDIIFIGGQNYYPHDLERVAEEVEGVELGRVAACGVFNPGQQKEEIVLFVLFKKRVAEFVPLAVNIKGCISRKTGLRVKAVVPVKDLPKTTSGKIQRYKLGEKYLNSEFSGVLDELNRLLEEEMKKREIDLPRTEAERILAEICKEALGGVKIGINDNFIAYGFDSIMVAKVQAEMEKAFPGKVTVTNIFACPTISKLADFIERGGGTAFPQLDLPAEYFGSNGSGDLASDFEFCLKGGLYNGLCSVSRAEGCDIYDILLSMYIYTLSEISGSRELTVHAMLGAYNSIAPVNAKLDGVEDFSGLFRMAADNRRASGGYPVEDIGKITVDRTGTSVLPLFYKKACLTANAGLHDVFDIILQARESGEGLNFVWEYNGRRLLKEKAREMAAGYVEMLTALIDEYNGGLEHE